MDEPDGFAVIHHGQNFTAYFGPFATLEEVSQFLHENPLVSANVVSLYKTVDWNRRG